MSSCRTRQRIWAVIAMVLLAALATSARAQTGACCVGTVCTTRTFSACDGAGGDFIGGSCSPNPCIGPTGACCTPGAGCAVRGELECLSPSVFLGADTACGSSTCPGACCHDDGPCTITGSLGCGGAGGVFRGFASTCGPNACPGACCFGNLCVTINGFDQCSGSGGFWQGIDSVCAAGTCDLGTCCILSFCFLTTQVGCTSSGWGGAGSICSPCRCNFPFSVGACCENGDCFLTCRGGCSGSFFDGALSCQGVPCGQIGVCCAGATCRVLAPGLCTGPNTHFVSGPFACNAPGNTSSPCCKADFNQSGVVSIQDIFDFLAAYFATDPNADFDGSGIISVQDIFDFLAAYFPGCP